jgi:membrane protein
MKQKLPLVMVLFTVHICVIAAVGLLLDLATLNLSKEPYLALCTSALPSLLIFAGTAYSILRRREFSIYYGIAAMIYLLITCGLGLLGGVALSSIGGQYYGGFLIVGSILIVLSFPGVITAIVWLIILLKKRAAMSEIFTEKTRENKFAAVLIFGCSLLFFLLCNLSLKDDKIGFLTRFIELLSQM